VTYPVSADPTWDDFRSKVWDLPGVDSVEVLLGVIGAAGLDRPAQQEAVREWAATPAYLPAPAPLKDQIREFIGD
jgi:hypothetical protein